MEEKDKMPASFPNIGNFCIGLKGFFEKLGVPMILPPPTTRRTIELGLKHSPEFVCFPYKVTMGCLIELLEKKVDTIMMIGGGLGICRLPSYGNLQEKTLKEMGYKVNFLLFNGFTLKRIFFKDLRKMAGNQKFYYFKLIRAIFFARKKLILLDQVDKYARKIRPRETKIGETTLAEKKSLKLIDGAKNMRDLRIAWKEIKKMFKNIRQDKNKEILRVSLGGEFFCVLEQYINLNIEEKLGNLGVEVIKDISPYELLKSALKINIKRKYLMIKGSEYLKVTSGGDDQVTIGEIIVAANKGYDGFIHLYPFQCMPENNAQATFPKIQKKYNIPILKFPIDEQTSDAGIQTRLEAFVDLMKRRKNKTKKIKI